MSVDFQMNLTKDLRKAVYRHLAAGIILSISLCTLILASKYQNSLFKTTADLDAIRINVLKMEHVVRVMREKQSSAFHMLPADYDSRSHREILLLSLERVRGFIKEADIIIENFAEENSEIILPLTLEFQSSLYYEGLNTIEYLRGLRFPYFRIRNVVVKKNEEGRNIIWRVEGSLRIPSEKFKGIPDRRASR